MNREFLDFYNRELGVLREQAAEFAAEYPGVAERLGGLVADRMDPMIAGLLEGSAFLAARVQLKLKHEFADFTTNLIDQLTPQYLAPTPSFLLTELSPKFGDPALREGRTIPRGAYFEATYRELERNVACRFRLAASATLWPFDLTRAEYLTSPAPLQALLPASGVEAAAGLRLQFTVRAAARREDEPSDEEATKKPELWASRCKVRSLRLHLLGPEADAIALYEQMFARLRGVYFRRLDSFGDPVAIRGGPEMLTQIGFAETEALIPNDLRLFRGFDILREYLAFPRKFLGFDLGGLDKIMPRLDAKTFDVIFAFDEVNPRLAASVRPEAFSLYAAPAVNLFEKTLDRIPVADNAHEHLVVADRSHPLDYEVNRLLNVFAHIPGVPEKTPVAPLYSAAAGLSRSGLSYTVRRLPRRRTAHEARFGRKSDYTGTEMFLSLGQRADDAQRVTELSLRALCTNRHLADRLPVGQGGADFRLLDDVTLEMRCLFGPTRPREPPMTAMAGRIEAASTGEIAWRLINMLSLNHLGLVDRGPEQGAVALRETLLLFADLSDGATERRIRGVRSLQAKPIVRRIRTPQGAAAARGLELTVLIDDKAFEGSGAFLIGAALDRFFAEYVAINHFTQTVVRTSERGEIMRWPPRLGLRGAL
ncbi:MAG TPA: type VI secretion system baseplate subunit TssF [Roseiarcus sp.]|nr:type VI secretion system baseplate subunit TssF [Roseiarcus sp.]